MTPLNAASLEKTLRDINILPRWEHVIEGLRSVFDIGLSAPVPRTISFSNPVTWSVVTQYIIFDLILSVLQHQSPFFISSYITSEQDTGLYSRAFEPGELEGMIGPFCTSPLPEAQLCFLSSCERPFFSRQQLRHTFREFFHRLRRLSYRGEELSLQPSLSFSPCHLVSLLPPSIFCRPTVLYLYTLLSSTTAVYPGWGRCMSIARRVSAAAQVLESLGRGRGSRVIASPRYPHKLAGLPSPHKARVLVHSDNARVTAVVNKGHSRSKLISDILQSIGRLLADLGLTLQAEHVASWDNISDPPSRRDLTTFFAQYSGPLCHVPFPLPFHLQGKPIFL